MQFKYLSVHGYIVISYSLVKHKKQHGEEGCEWETNEMDTGEKKIVQEMQSAGYQPSTSSLDSRSRVERIGKLPMQVPASKPPQPLQMLR